jgi:hypothetical protein
MIDDPSWRPLNANKLVYRPGMMNKSDGGFWPISERQAKGSGAKS